MVATEFLQQLRQRREELGMPLRVLAKRVGVSMLTLQRILHGHASAHFDKVLAIADALGIDFNPQERARPQDMRREQARARAKQLTQLVQGTMALEGQAVDSRAYEEMMQRTTFELLDSNRKLWD